MQREQTQENTKARERQGKGKGIQSTRTKRLTHSHAATKKDEKGTTPCLNSQRVRICRANRCKEMERERRLAIC